MISTLVRTEIRAMSNADLDALVTIVKARRMELNAQASMKFEPGDRVRFAGKRGRTTEGTVTRLMRGGNFEITNCTDGFTWRYPPSMLTKV